MEVIHGFFRSRMNINNNINCHFWANNAFFNLDGVRPARKSSDLRLNFESDTFFFVKTSLLFCPRANRVWSGTISKLPYSCYDRYSAKISSTLNIMRRIEKPQKLKSRISVVYICVHITAQFFANSSLGKTILRCPRCWRGLTAFEHKHWHLWW